ncbi:hypothetical protein RB195_001289 [Necator americanus]|uniref:Uncharacterized protein n=1 Tax=Necator americanus TaxID=51031 RepID=A0ABR1DDK4_NECAM
MPEGNKESMTAKTRLAMSLPGQPQRATLSNLLRHLHAPFAAFYETVSDRHIMSDGNSTPSTAAMLMKGRLPHFVPACKVSRFLEQWSRQKYYGVEEMNTEPGVLGLFHYILDALIRSPGHRHQINVAGEFRFCRRPTQSHVLSNSVSFFHSFISADAIAAKLLERCHQQNVDVIAADYQS